MSTDRIIQIVLGILLALCFTLLIYCDIGRAQWRNTAATYDKEVKYYQKESEARYDIGYRQAILDAYFLRPTRYRIMESEDGTKYFIFKMESQEKKDAKIPTIINPAALPEPEASASPASLTAKK